LPAPLDPLPFTLGRWVGRSLPRLEDGRLLTGSGEFIADLRLPDALQVVLGLIPEN
jgi:CO/xanthine dehydrogenase Mo-binding subunit